MAFSDWKPVKDVPPSLAHHGEVDTSTIYTVVGRALSQWEQVESIMTRLFQVMCETPHYAACRAFGIIESPYTKSEMLRVATDAFFARRNALREEEHEAIRALIKAYKSSQEYRNNIAHGTAIGFFLKRNIHSGYFLCPPSCATRKVEKIDPREVYVLGAKYWYTASDINHFYARFVDIVAEGMRVIQAVNHKYRVLKDSELHP